MTARRFGLMTASAILVALAGTATAGRGQSFRHTGAAQDRRLHQEDRRFHAADRAFHHG